MRSKGPINPATCSAMWGEIPLGRKLGSAPPARCVTAAVASSIVLRFLDLDGLKFSRSVRSHSSIIILEDAFTPVGSVTIV